MSDRELRELERRWRESRGAEQGAAWVRALERSGAPAYQVVRARAELESPEYMAAVAGLPRPTAQQIADYARWVASAHSWYKHLPLDPPVPFTFFLLPWLELHHSDEGWHYNDHPPSWHEQYYGHLEYGRLTVPGQLELPRPGAPDPPVCVPPALLEVGTVPVTALIHPRCDPGMLERHASWNGFQAYQDRLARGRGLLSRLAARLPGGTPVTLQSVWEEYVPAERARLLRSMEDAMHAVVEVVWGPAPAHERPPGREPHFGERDHALARLPPVARLPRPPRPGDGG